MPMRTRSRASPPPSMWSPASSRTCRPRRSKPRRAWRRFSPPPSRSPWRRTASPRRISSPGSAFPSRLMRGVDSARRSARGAGAHRSRRRCSRRGASAMTARARCLIRGEDDAAAALEAIGSVPAVLEGLVLFEREISVIVVRGQDGALAFYDPVENVHQNGILAISRVPAAHLRTARPSRRRQHRRQDRRGAVACRRARASRCSSARAIAPR